MVAHAADLAHAFRGRVVLVTVMMEPIVVKEYAPPPELLRRLTVGNEKAVQRRLAELEKQRACHATRSTSVILRGSPARRILEQASKTAILCVDRRGASEGGRGRGAGRECLSHSPRAFGGVASAALACALDRFRHSDFRLARARRDADDALLIDVREPREWKKGVAERALLLPLSDLTGSREQGRPFLAANAGRELLLYCAAGGRSAIATRVLATEGFRAANAGSLDEWSAAGWPIIPPSAGR